MLLIISYSHRPLVWIPFATIVALIISASLLEFFQMAKNKGLYPKTELILTLSIVYFASWVFFYHTSLSPLLPSSVLLATLIAPFLVAFRRGEEPIKTISVSLFGFFYITLPLTCFYLINYYFPTEDAQSGPIWLLYLVLVTKVGDMMAYFIGSKLGEKKLAPKISPKKTLEGSLGGLLGSIVTSLIFSFTALEIGLFESILLGFVMGVLGQLGDLAESLLKRDAGVKDSSSLPGLGGVLDIVDSMIFTCPFIFLYLIHRWPECL